MRPPSQPRSLLHQPLNAVLGTPAGVRVFRALTQSSEALTPPALAHRAGLTPEAVRQTLDRFVDLGVVHATGGGRRAYVLNTGYPLVAALAAAFEVEAVRIRALVELVSITAKRSRPAPLAVWLYGSVVRAGDTPASDVDLAVIGREPHVQRQSARLRATLDEFAARHQIRPSVVALTPEALRRMVADNAPFWKNLSRDAAVLFGASPQEVLAATH